MSSPRSLTKVAPRVGAALLGVWFVLPLLPLALWAGAERWSAPAVLPQAWGLGGLSQALATGGPGAFAQSAALGLLVAGVATPLGGLAGFALARGRPWCPRATALILLAPLALPPFAIALGLDTVILRAHVPSLAGLTVILAAVALPYTTYLMWLAGSAHDPLYAEEARTLGASARVALWRVQLPLLAPSIAGAAFLAFLVGWSDYVVTVIVGAGQFVTVPVLLASYAADVGNEPLVAVLALAGLLPPLAFYLLLRRLRPGQVTP